MAAQQNTTSDRTFIERLLEQQALGTSWKSTAAVVAELWIRQAAASAALILGVESPTQLTATCLRTRADGTLQATETTIEVPYSTLLSSEKLLEAAASTGLIGGLHLSLHCWPQLLSAIVLQFPDATIDPTATLFQILEATSARLLAAVNNRPVMIPDPAVLEAMAEYSAGAGHEINNPLASIIGQTQVLLKTETSVDRRQSLETIGAQAWRVRDMIINSMLFARPPAPQLSSFNLIHPIQEALESLEEQAESSGVQFLLSAASEKLAITADRAQISHMLTELIRNSVEALRGAGRPGTISISLQESVPGVAELTIRDDGPGLVSATARRNAFNPFYSGRSAGRGLGFGLSLAWRIVQTHRGMLYLREGGEGGITCCLALPLQATGN